MGETLGIVKNGKDMRFHGKTEDSDVLGRVFCHRGLHNRVFELNEYNYFELLD